MSAPLKQFVITENSKAYWRITFGNPPLNLINPETVRELKVLMELIEAEKDLRVVVFDSANPEFYFARYDLSRAAETPTEPGPTGFPAWIDFILRIAQSPVISIASIRGRTRGGGSELVLSFDMRFASKERAIFGQPEVAGGSCLAVGRTNDCRNLWEGPARSRSSSGVMISMPRPPSAMAGSIGAFRTASWMDLSTISPSGSRHSIHRRSQRPSGW